MKASDVLIVAKALISSPKKWCKGEFDQPGDKHCPQGAILTVAETLEDREPSFRARSYLMKVVGITTSWNDAPERTHDEVMVAFDKAIELAKRDED